jgi:hypothetical protein
MQGVVEEKGENRSMTTAYCQTFSIVPDKFCNMRTPLHQAKPAAQLLKQADEGFQSRRRLDAAKLITAYLDEVRNTAGESDDEDDEECEEDENNQSSSSILLAEVFHETNKLTIEPPTEESGMIMPSLASINQESLFNGTNSFGSSVVSSPGASFAVGHKSACFGAPDLDSITETNYQSASSILLEEVFQETNKLAIEPTEDSCMIMPSLASINQASLFNGTNSFGSSVVSSFGASFAVGHKSACLGATDLDPITETTEKRVLEDNYQSANSILIGEVFHETNQLAIKPTTEGSGRSMPSLSSGNQESLFSGTYNSSGSSIVSSFGESSTLGHKPPRCLDPIKEMIERVLESGHPLPGRSSRQLDELQPRWDNSYDQLSKQGDQRWNTSDSSSKKKDMSPRITETIEIKVIEDGSSDVEFERRLPERSSSITLDELQPRWDNSYDQLSKQGDQRWNTSDSSSNKKDMTPVIIRR